MIAAAVAIVLGVGSAVAVAKVRRDREWAHGGDALTVQVQLRLADAQTLPAAATALGHPADEPVLLPSEFPQSVVVRVQWRGPAPGDGSYQLIVLDKRLTPPHPLPVYGGWNANGGTGSKLGECVRETRRALRLARRHRLGPGRNRRLDLDRAGSRCPHDRLRRHHGDLPGASRRPIPHRHRRTPTGQPLPRRPQWRGAVGPACSWIATNPKPRNTPNAINAACEYVERGWCYRRCR